MTDSAQQTTPEPVLVPRRDLPRLLRPFRTSAYRRLAVSLVLTTFAFGVWVVGQVWEVIRIGGGPSQLSVVSTATAIGVLLPALLAGVVADRVPQKTILLWVTAVQLAGMSVVGVLSLTDLTQVWHLAAVAFTIGMSMAFYYPAYSAWLPALVPESDLLAVNGFEGMVRPTVGQASRPAARATAAITTAAPDEAAPTAAPATAGPMAWPTVGRTIPSKPLTAIRSDSGTIAGSQAEYAA